ncbi:RelA/SpoT family protein [Patescibacteria group bacterium]
MEDSFLDAQDGRIVILHHGKNQKYLKTMGIKNLEKCITYCSQEEKALIIKAYETACKYHKNQKRESGEDYIAHPLSVAYELAKLKCDAKTIAASLLHDTLEDSSLKRKELEKEFGTEIAFLVEGVSKLDKITYQGTQRKIESLRKMFIAFAEDIRVVLIKVFDRLHNMQTISHLPQEKQQRIALETIELYAPLAYRLGMGDVKGRLEDLAFPILYPEEHEWILNETKERIPKIEKQLKRIIPIIQSELKKENIEPVDIHKRTKHVYSLWRKLLKYDLDFGRVFDLAAVRIIVSSLEECYAVLGIIHKLWKPLPGRIKDYIALPKPNGYKSLHTTVFTLNDTVAEFQIRTDQMHEEAEFGIAAHLDYKEKREKKIFKSSPISHIDSKKTSLMKQLREWQNAFSDTQGEEFVESLKIDLFRDRIFVLTPKGEVIDLPEGSTPIDFAYHIHSEVGDHMVGAKVNGKLVAFSKKLQNGDAVQIIIQKKRVPSPDWIDMAHTPMAKSHIRSALRKAGFNLPEKSRKKPKKEMLIKIRVRDRVGLIKDISSVLAEEKINIIRMEGENAKENPYPELYFYLIAQKKEKLDKLLTKIRAIKGVKEVNLEKSTL